LFQRVWNWLRGERAELELSFLGDRKAKLRHKVVSLRQRQADVLASLVVYPQGLTSEQLALYLYGEVGQARSAKSEAVKLKALIPISARPYRIGVQYLADFQAVRKALKQGQLRQAIPSIRGHSCPVPKHPW
jgi:hypothetical protein